MPIKIIGGIIFLERSEFGVVEFIFIELMKGRFSDKMAFFMDCFFKSLGSFTIL